MTLLDRHIDADEVAEAMKGRGVSFGFDQGGHIWHGPAGLALRLGTSYGRVVRRLEELAALGIVAREPQGAGYWRLAD